jgi:Trk K+ transport system NAD-binding subunit
MARLFKVMPKHTIIVGADETARLLAAELAAAGETVSLIDSDKDSCALAGGLRGARVFCADATDLTVLRRAGAEEAKCLIAATPSDKVNLLVCQVARAAFGDMRMVARANSTSNLAAFEAAGIEAMSPTRAAATVLENMVLRPSLFGLLAAGGGAEHVAEVKVSSPESENQTLAKLALRDCVVVAIRRDGRLIAPNGHTKLRGGDVLTLLGSESSIEMARAKLRISD